MEKLIFIISNEYSNIRIDKYLTDQLQDLSRGYIQNLISDGNILCNDKIIKSNYKTKENDQIIIRIPPPKELDIKPQDIAIDIVYEDEHIIIVNKPKYMVVHPSAGHFDNTLVNALLYHCRGNLSSINGVHRPGIVHRIDMNTTGLLVVCKSDLAHRVLSDKFKVHDITRRYTAIVYNHFKDDSGTIDKPIGRSKSDRKKMTIDLLGRNAITHYKVLKNLKNNFSLIECELETGRTHQIRVHMASINHPLLGDETYGPKDIPFKTDGQVLHAGVLGFNHPITNDYMEFTKELPDYFNNIIKRLT